MPSPFPEMNPYFEQEEVWHDFHQAFVPAIRRALVRQIGSRYFVTLELHIYIRELASNERRLLGRADVGIGTPRSHSAGESTNGVLEAPTHALSRRESMSSRNRSSKCESLTHANWSPQSNCSVHRISTPARIENPT